MAVVLDVRSHAARPIPPDAVVALYRAQGQRGEGICRQLLATLQGQLAEVSVVTLF
jgi:hypothetical protein